MFMAVDDEDDYRKGIKYNALLPYGDTLNADADQVFDEIKRKIATCLSEAEIRPGLISWLYHLQRYVVLYGFRFSKEDHIELVHLLLDVICISGLDLGSVQAVALTICRLLKPVDEQHKATVSLPTFRKKYLLSPDDLTIKWRPLFELTNCIIDNSLEFHGLLHCPEKLENSLNSLVRACRPYFEITATQEMLDEWLVDLCPYDEEREIILRRLQIFLPTTLPAEHYDKGWKLWFDRLITMWKLDRRGGVETILSNLFARLAEENIGHIDWEPYLPDIFTRLLRSFNLPYGSGNIQVLRRTCSGSEATQLTRWIVACLGGGSSSQMHLEQIFRTIESFYHPSNDDDWSNHLNNFLGRLCDEFLDRVWLERYRTVKWGNPIPESKKLTDTDIDAFVNMIHPIALVSIFSKKFLFGNRALQCIAFLRPESVIPCLLEKLNDALYSLTEPHRLISTIMSMEFVVRLLVLRHTSLGVPIDVPGLLMACLPGIDSNDHRKTAATFRLISSIVMMIPMVDCSSIADKVAPNLQQVCLNTGIFEEFILEMLSRCFVVIENTVAEMNHHRENQSFLDSRFLEIELTVTFSKVFGSLSPTLYRAAVNKLHSFVNNKIIDPITGKLVALIVRHAVTANPTYGLQTFLPHFAKLALALMEPEEVLNDEKTDNELQFSLILLGEMVQTTGDAIHPHLPLITSVLKRSLKLSARAGYLAASLLLSNTLKSLVSLYLEPYEDPLKSETLNADDPPVLHWAKSENIDTVKVDFHIPGDQDLAAAKALFDECVSPVLSTLRLWYSDPEANPLTKEGLHRALLIVEDSLQGLGSCLPPLQGEHVNILDSVSFDFKPSMLQKTFAIENLREIILEDMERTVETIFKMREDDIRSLLLISNIIRSLTFYFGTNKPDYTLHYKDFKLLKRMLDMKLCKQNVKRLKYVIADRVLLQHELLQINKYSKFSTSHVRAMKILFQMATSHYSQVRRRSQEELNKFFATFSKSYSVILDDICGLLVNPEMTHDQYKGVLHTLVGNEEYMMVPVNNWDATRKLWPSLVNAKHSEKPSIIILLNRINDQISKYMETYPIKITVPRAIANRAMALCGQTKDLPECIENGSQNVVIYNQLLEELTRLIRSGSLHWRHHYLGLLMLRMLLREDVLFGPDTVRLVIDELLSEHLRTRKMCINILSGILYQQRRKMKRIKVARETLEKINAEIPLNPYFEKCLEGGKTRPFNLFLQLNSANYPDTKEKWDRAIFVHKPYIGYNGFKDEIEVYAPDSEQPALASLGNMNEVEQIIYDSFSNEDYIKKLVFYLAIEENKGKDKFDGKRVSMFKLLFRNFGDAFLDKFTPYLNKFLIENRQEFEQRCALEIIAGLVRGSKHWNFEMSHRLAKIVVPLFESGINNMTQDTLHDWGICVATVLECRDCNQFYWFLEMISKDIFTGSLFIQSCKLYCLLGGLVQMRWRALEMTHRLLDELKLNLAHPYLNVRQRIAHLLAYIFAFDVRINDGKPTKYEIEENFLLAPKSHEFLANAMENLHTLKLDNHEQEKEVAKRMFQTLLKWQASHCAQSYACVLPEEALRLLPMACRLIADKTNEDLQKDCGLLIAILGYELLSNKTLHTTMSCIEASLDEPFWNVRNFAVSLLMFVTYSNLFIITADPTLAKNVNDIVLRAISDDRIEVRITAQEALAGLIHCGLLELTDDVLTEAKAKLSKVSRRLRNRRRHQRQLLEARRDGGGDSSSVATPDDPAEEQKLIIEYHAAVLLLCACVVAFPYDVPDFMPDIICVLADHLNAPQPIPTTIKKSLSDFKRTHIDNWRVHKEKFSEEQLTVVTDLLVSPSYYA